MLRKSGTNSAQSFRYRRHDLYDIWQQGKKRPNL
jgi:hypothetical protein